MAETEEFEKFNFNSKNGRFDDIGGRPTKEFLEAKRAIEIFDVLKEHFGGEFLAGILRGDNRGPKKGSKIDLEGVLKNLDPTSLVLNLLKPLGGVAAAVGGLWLAEEYIKLPVKDTRTVNIEQDVFDEEGFDIATFEHNSRVARNRGIEFETRPTREDFTSVVTGPVEQEYTKYVAFPPILHTILDILGFILPLITQAIEFMDGTVVDAIKTTKEVTQSGAFKRSPAGRYWSTLTDVFT